MRIFFLLALALLVLGACGEKEEPPQPPTTATTNPYEGTEQPPEDLPGQEMVPGVRASSGLEVVDYNAYTNDKGFGWIVLEVRNSNPFAVRAMDVTISLLDSNNRERDFQRAVSPFLNIPAGYTVPFVLEFLQPTDYADFVALADVDDSAGGSFGSYVGEYDLPSTTDPLPSGNPPYIVSGTLTNDRGLELIAPAATVVAYDAAGKLLGVAQAVLAGTTERGTWAAGASLTFQATFPYLPAPIATVRVASAGYHAQ